MGSSSAPARLAFVVPYVGKLPPWSTLFFESCRRNPVIDVLLLSQAALPSTPPPNVHVVRMGREEIFSRIGNAIGLKLRPGNAHKLCDFKPFYGLAFADLLKGYEFWGYCDLDMMFGSLEKLLTDDFLSSLDIFTANDTGHFVGHFTILRNTPLINNLCFEIDGWKESAAAPGWSHMDEERILAAVRKNPRVRLSTPNRLASELNSPFARFGITFGALGEVTLLDPPDTPVVKWDSGGVYYESDSGRVTEALYVHFLGTKLWWHWILFNRRAAARRVHYFSRIGYGGVRHPADLHRFPWRELYWLQSRTFSAKVALGRPLRRWLPRRAFSLLRWLLHSLLRI